MFSELYVATEKKYTYRLFGAYIKRGTRLTVHINNHGTKDLQVKMIWYEIELNSNNAKDVCPFWEATNFKAQRLWGTSTLCHTSF